MAPKVSIATGMKEKFWVRHLYLAYFVSFSLAITATAPEPLWYEHDRTVPGRDGKILQIPSYYTAMGLRLIHVTSHVFQHCGVQVEKTGFAWSRLQ